MFLHTLSETQQKAFLALAKQFIAADGTLSAEEQGMFELMRRETGLSANVELPDVAASELAAVFDDRQARASVLLELIGIGYADSKFCAAEHSFVSGIAEQFGFTKPALVVMENWVLRQLALANEAAEFWTE